MQKHEVTMKNEWLQRLWCPACCQPESLLSPAHQAVLQMENIVNHIVQQHLLGLPGASPIGTIEHHMLGAFKLFQLPGDLVVGNINRARDMPGFVFVEIAHIHHDRLWCLFLQIKQLLGR